MATIKVSKVKNRNRCWSVAYKQDTVDLLDVRDLKNESLVIKYDYTDNVLLIRLSTVVGTKGATVRKPNPKVNGYLSSFTLETDIEEGQYDHVDSYDKDGYTFHEFEFVD